MLDCERFQPAEWICRAYLTKKGYTYINLTKNSQYYNDDIDLLVFRDDIGEQISIEVKGSNFSRSLYAETEVYNKKTQKKVDGWFYKCRAQQIFVVDMRDGFIYTMLLEDLRRYITTQPTREAKHEGKEQSTTGRIVYIDDMIRCGYEVGEINLEKIFQ